MASSISKSRAKGNHGVNGFTANSRWSSTGSEGKPSIVVVCVYESQYANGHISAGLVPPATINDEHPFGVVVGRISFVFPKGGLALVKHTNEPIELKSLSGELTLAGHTVPVGFTRENGNTPPPETLPKAKQTG